MDASGSPHEHELGSAQETNMVDGNAFAREFREVSTNLRPRQLESEDGTDVNDYMRGVSEAFAFIALRLSGEDQAAYERWLEGLLEQVPDAAHGDG